MWESSKKWRMAMFIVLREILEIPVFGQSAELDIMRFLVMGFLSIDLYLGRKDYSDV
jgi:hypothetical protein